MSLKLQITVEILFEYTDLPSDPQKFSFVLLDKKIHFCD